MKIFVIGAGAFGTAISNALCQNSANQVFLWSNIKEDALEINKTKVNENYFPNRKLHDNLRIVYNQADILNADVIFLAIPSGSILDFIEDNKCSIKENALIVNLAKGLYKEGLTPVDLLKSMLPNEIITLKGPSYAIEVLNNSPTIFTLGFYKQTQYEIISQIFRNTNLFLDYSTDIRGVEILSVVKNIYSIVLGIVDAKYNSANTRFMILTKAFKEIRIILEALGGHRDTLFLSCGFGDFGLTALNDLSRNRTLGLLIGKGFYNSSTVDNSVVLEGVNAMSIVYSILNNEQRRNTPLLNQLISYFGNKNALNYQLNFRNLVDSKMRTVLTYGTFDLLHYGHVEILRRARELGDRLIVGLSTDEFNEMKGKKCVFSYQKRKKLLEAIEYVDQVIPENNWEQKTEDVKKYGIDIFVMGDDWKGKFDFLSDYTKVHYLPRTKGISTTKLKTIL